MKRMLTFLSMVIFIMASSVSLFAQTDNKDALIEQIISVDKKQREAVHTVVMDAEYIEGEWKDDEFKEKVKLIKKIYIKYEEDTAYYYEDYLEYYKDGELKEEKDLRKEEKDRKEKMKKRRAKNVSAPMIKAFYPEYKELYEIEYMGIAEEKQQDRTCHHFKVKANEEVDSLINGDFYFDSETFNLVQVDFTPAKLVKKTMFKMKELKMSLAYAPDPASGFWFPSQFDIEGKGKAMFFIGVKFSGTEYYSNPVINQNIDDKFVEEENGDD